MNGSKKKCQTGMREHGDASCRSHRYGKRIKKTKKALVCSNKRNVKRECVTNNQISHEHIFRGEAVVKIVYTSLHGKRRCVYHNCWATEKNVQCAGSLCCHCNVWISSVMCVGACIHTSNCTLRTHRTLSPSPVKWHAKHSINKIIYVIFKDDIKIFSFVLQNIWIYKIV